MIKSLRLGSFKRFEDLSVRTTRLTVLTGLNGSGKSTVLQGLLLAQAAALSEGDTVPLEPSNGLDLGYASDIVNINAPSSQLRIQLNADESTTWVFDSGPAGEGENPYLHVVSRPVETPYPIGDARGGFTYLRAERLGPRTSLPTSPTQPGDAVVGEDGRFVAHALAVGARREVPIGRRHPEAPEIASLTVQSELWLSDLVGRTQLEAALVPRTGLATLRLRSPGRFGEWMLPTNTGFGLSYSLPVVVAGMLAPVGGVLIVDSPEAHLHPAAQSAMGGFLAMVAGAGVQVLVETHSEHVLNGMRKSVALADGLQPDEVTIAYFGESPTPSLLSIDQKGRLSAWPEGFFDQSDRDLGALTRARRS